MTFTERVACLLQTETPQTVLVCLGSELAGGLYDVLAFFLMVLIIGGWILGLGPSLGMMIGGFLATLITAFFWASGLSSIIPTMISIIIMIIGLVFIIVELAKK